MNYLQHIGAAQNSKASCADLRMLVSGVDALVREIVGRDIVSACYARGKTLFILDNTQENAPLQGELGGYQITDLLIGGVCLCPDLLEVSSLAGASRLRGILASLGFQEMCAMKVVAYLSFVKETERRLGNLSPLTVDILDEYSSARLVEWKLRRLVQAGKMEQDNASYLLGKYAEVSGAAADFDMMCTLLAPFLCGAPPARNMAIRIPMGDYTLDKPLQEVMSQMMLNYVRQNAASSAVLILDDGRGGERKFIIDVLKQLPAETVGYLFSNDAFSFDDAGLSVVMNTLPVRIFTRHEDMASAEKIEARCGQIDVVRRTTSVTIDRRWRANSAWDMLLGNNKTETETRNAPVKEYRFRKELIHALPRGTGIIDCAGSQVLFTFQT